MRQTRLRHLDGIGQEETVADVVTLKKDLPPP